MKGFGAESLHEYRHNDQNGDHDDPIELYGIVARLHFCDSLKKRLLIIQSL